MKKLTLLGSKQEQDALVNALARSQILHIIDAPQPENTVKDLKPESKDDKVRKMAEVQQAMAIIKGVVEANTADKTAKKQIANKVELSYDDFLSYGDEELRLTNIIKEVSSCHQLIGELNIRIASTLAEIKELTAYSALDIALSDVKDTEHTIMRLGLCKLTEDRLNNELILQYPNIQFALLSRSETLNALLAVAHKEDEEILRTLLEKYEFTPCRFSLDTTAAQAIIARERLVDELKTQLIDCNATICSYASEFASLKILYDYYFYNHQVLLADEDCTLTESTFLLQGWYCAQREEQLTKLLDTNLTAYCVFYDDAKEDERVPTLIKSNKIVEPFTSITDMYSTPDYREIDPNPLVAIFYWVFMGLMMGDVGYGVLMSLIAIVALKVLKPTKGMRNLMLIIGFGGISTIIWGVLFGGWFAVENFVDPLLLSPLYNPLGMMELSLVLGTVQLICGYALGAANLIAKGKWLDAILDYFTWMVFDAGLICLIIAAFTSINGGGDTGNLLNIGLYLCAGALAVLVVTGGRKSKGFGKVVGGLGSVYSIINVLSDVLSYLRLFGLGLTTGIIGMAFNVIAGLLLGSPVGFIFGVIVLIIGHTLNLAISLLGVYIHDARLQHIEFFGRFYTGEGLPFKPVANILKYTNLTDR